MFKRACTALPALLLACALASCAKLDLTPDLLPLSKETMMLLGKKGMDPQAPIFIRVFKEESELELWKQRADGRFYHLKTYPICNWSGELGPKVKQGDRQAPEGFYTVTREQMNPNSSYHLALNLGYPNAYDRSLRRTGEFLMIHGKCKSAGCYAMTDALIEEIYAITREAFQGPNDSFQVHAFPFRMTADNMARHANHEAQPFWRTLKEGYDYFELTRQVPTVAVCNRRYVVNVAWPGGEMGGLNPEGACPAFFRPRPDPFRPRPGEEMAEFQRVIVPGPKMRDVASVDQGGPRSGASSGLTGNGLSTSSIGSARGGAPANMSFAPAR
ncbi:MAG: murein L,D-transpeptidase family protein [Hyphomicrobiaceae bacterium]